MAKPSAGLTTLPSLPRHNSTLNFDFVNQVESQNGQNHSMDGIPPWQRPFLGPNHGTIELRFSMHRFFRSFAILLTLSTTIATTAAIAQTTNSATRAPKRSTYTTDEIMAQGHQFFGKTSRGLAQAIEYVFQNEGEPTAYIVGEEGSGAFVGGLRYGEGTIYYKNGAKKHIYWQGPSVGFDFGGNGSRTLTLVYNSQSPEDLYDRFAGVEGTAYLVGGVGVNFQRKDNITLAPIRTGVGARLGANIGYLKYSPRATWNPF